MKSVTRSDNECAASANMAAECPKMAEVNLNAMRMVLMRTPFMVTEYIRESSLFVSITLLTLLVKVGALIISDCKNTTEISFEQIFFILVGNIMDNYLYFCIRN